MQRLIIKDLEAIVSCDANDAVYKHADIVIEGNAIAKIGPNAAQGLEDGADIIDGAHLICYPGLINTHNHFYQYFSRNLPQVQNMELFDWPVSYTHLTLPTKA